MPSATTATSRGHLPTTRLAPMFDDSSDPEPRSAIESGVNPTGELETWETLVQLPNSSIPIATNPCSIPFVAPALIEPP